MAVIGQFKITGSFKITGRGLCVMGDLTAGRAKVGSFVTFHTGVQEVTMKIAGVDMGDSISEGTYFVGLTFVYKNETERVEFEGMKLSEQIVNIEDTDGASVGRI